MFSERIQPIQLPKRSYEYRNFKHKLAIASGWGRYATGVHAISKYLRYVQLPIIDGFTCKRTFPASYRATNICTSGRNAKSTCNGDSGGPLVLRRRNSRKRVLIGLTSFGSIFGCDRGYPAAFTKVASYLDWINDHTGVMANEEFGSNAVLFKQYLKNYANKKPLAYTPLRYRPIHGTDILDEDDDDDLVDDDEDSYDGAIKLFGKLSADPSDEEESVVKKLQNKNPKFDKSVGNVMLVDK